MKVLVTGAKGFVGKNLCAQLNNIREGKTQCYGDLIISKVFEYDIDSTAEELDRYCRESNFVFNLAGVNRPQNQEDFMKGNFGFATILLDTLKKHNNTCPVMTSSSIQASLDNPYGESKRAGEQLMFQYAQESGAKVLVYRFPNVFGKWCRPNYNSVVATFCYNIAHDLPITVNDPNRVMNLIYIDDLVNELIAALQGKEHYICDPDLSERSRYCEVQNVHTITLGEIVDLLNQFKELPNTQLIPEMPEGSFAKKLFSTYLSYLPKEKAIFSLKMNVDARGSFTELVHTLSCGQISINVSKPGITKGQHWHHTKWEQFIVVSGHGLIQMRKEGTDEVLEYEVSGNKIQSVIMLPGYTHNIINISDTEDLVTVMWANELFDSNRPDTYSENVI